MLNTDDFHYSAIKGDASKRKFYKVTSKNNRYILMDSSQEIRSYRNYLKFHKIFSKNLNLPVIYQKNNERNVILMEDLGVKLINDKLKNSYDEKLYEKLILNIRKKRFCRFFDPSDFWIFSKIGLKRSLEPINIGRKPCKT